MRTPDRGPGRLAAPCQSVTTKLTQRKRQGGQLTAREGSRLPGGSAPRNRGLSFDGRLRLAIVLFGGMVALQSSPTFDAAKIGYLAVTALCLIGASIAAWRARDALELRFWRPWIASSVALATLIALSLVIARANGIAITDWARDAAAYALFAAVPIFALDGGAFASRKLLVAMLLVAGLLGGLSLATEWLGRRDILELPFARIAFPSGQLPGMLYLFAMATSFTSGRGSARWPVLAGAILGLFLLTGTRSSLLLLVGTLAMALLAARARIPSTVRIFLLHGVVAVAVVVAFQVALALPVVMRVGQPTPEPGSSGATATLTPSVLGDRFGSIFTLVGNPSSDGSIKERVAQYRAAWALFVSSPIVGVGPGHSIKWIDVSGYPRTGFTADTPLVMPAKFGLLGILVFLGPVLAYGSTVRASLRRDRRSAITLTLVGYGVWTLVSLGLGFPIEDKGVSLALILLLSLALAERAAHRPPEASPEPALDARMQRPNQIG